MFFKKNYARMVKSNKWDKLNEQMEKGDAKINAEIAAACGESNTDESRNMLVRMINEPDRNVRLAAIKAMAAVGNSASLSHIRRAQKNCSADDAEMIEALADAARAITGKKD